MSYIRYLFRPESVFEPSTQNNIFWPFLDPKFSNFFGLKKLTFKWVCGPQNFILDHFFACSKCPNTISKKYFSREAKIKRVKNQPQKYSEKNFRSRSIF